MHLAYFEKNWDETYNIMAIEKIKETV